VPSLTQARTRPATAGMLCSSLQPRLQRSWFHGFLIRLFFRAMARAADYMLTAEEIRLRTRKRRRIALVLLSVLVLGLAAFFGARPAANAIKGWQSRRHATKAFALIGNGSWNAARNEVTAA